MAAQAKISKARLKNKIGRRMTVLIDAIEEGGTAIGRSAADAPEIDGTVRIARGADLAVGAMVEVEITRATQHDLTGRRL